MNEHYKSFDRITEELDVKDYEDCMFIACKRLGMTNINVYYQYDNFGSGGFGDLHVEATFKGQPVYYYLKQQYGSCSQCDWLQGSGEEDVINLYIEYVKEALAQLEIETRGVRKILIEDFGFEERETLGEICYTKFYKIKNKQGLIEEDGSITIFSDNTFYCQSFGGLYNQIHEDIMKLREKGIIE